MIGNGVTDWKYDGVASYVEMGYWHGLYDMQTHDEINQKCDLAYFDFRTESLSDECMNLVMLFMNDTDVIDIYDIYRVVDIPEMT
jgi:hypothetical protein